MKSSELVALRHLLKSCEQYDFAKKKHANMPDVFRENNELLTEQLLLGVSAGTWVLLKSKSGDETVQMISDVLEKYEYLLNAMEQISRFENGCKTNIREFAQDVLATINPPKAAQ